MTDLQNHIESMREDTPIPKDEFGLAHNLLNSKQTGNRFSDIVDINIQVTNIKDPKLMRSYQEAMIILTQLKALAEQDPEVIGPVYCLIHNSVRNELLMTKANGDERKLLASLGNTSKFNTHGGLGQGLQPDPGWYEDMNEEKEKGNFISNLFNRKK
jgi:hypothetical protein